MATQSLSAPLFHGEWILVPWVAPKFNWIQISADESSKGNPDVSWSGVVPRDDQRKFIGVVAKRKGGLLNYMLFLRVTPTLPNTFINVASPIVDVPFHIFFLATSIGLIPAAYVTVRAGIAIGELRSVGDLYDFQSIATMFLIGIVSVTPTLMSKSKSDQVHLE
ncbi:hypothetical protein GIB67_002000 [Kingdonia uniflora]|uniref:VTT domain-containing protein n=1 Tax=Kingdonia uniflora TaxID=39325 RepID=A0A7J7MA17_9MAGN|nr:hypothetical protein GIB67_002000 [Kingdonia uniflora]